MNRWSLLPILLLAACQSLVPRPPAPAGAAPFHIGEAEIRAAIARDRMSDTEVLRVTPLGGDSFVSWAVVRIRTTEPLHYHEQSDLSVTLLSGGGSMRMGEGDSQTVRTVREGDVLRIPRRYAHAFENTARGVSTALVVSEPPAVAGDFVPCRLPAGRRRVR